VAQIEEITKVPQKFRYPFFHGIAMVALDKYVYSLFGRTHLDLNDDEQDFLLGEMDDRKAFYEALDKTHRHITPQELFGIKAIVMYIHALAVTKKNVPPLLKEPINLVRDIKLLVEKHKNDDPALAVTGQPMLFWSGIRDSDKTYNSSKMKAKNKRKHDYFYSPLKEGSYKAEKPTRMPCKICQACIAPDCTKCEFCVDMIRFGGPGRLRKPCQLRKCLQPLLPLDVCCFICGLDGWYAEANVRLVDRPPGTCALMECKFCEEVTHPTCVTDYGVDGYIRMDLPNHWECPRCIKNKNANAASSTSSEPGPSPEKMIKKEEPPEDKVLHDASIIK